MASFPGPPAYIERARVALELTEAEADVAKGQRAVNQVATLVCQAVDRAEGPHPDTIRRVNELVDGLCLAAEAAILMRALVIPDAPASTSTESPVVLDKRKGAMRGNLDTA